MNPMAPAALIRSGGGQGDHRRIGGLEHEVHLAAAATADFQALGRGRIDHGRVTVGDPTGLSDPGDDHDPFGLHELG